VKWIFERVDGTGKGRETPIGIVPTPDAIDQNGLTISKDAMELLVAVEPGDWAEASAEQATFFKSLGSRVPQEMFEEQKRLADALDPHVAK
jgi:phosphoenolpyruvate carboxykinase (GTP)